jgi:hypothetical protein
MEPKENPEQKLIAKVKDNAIAAYEFVAENAKDILEDIGDTINDASPTNEPPTKPQPKLPKTGADPIWKTDGSTPAPVWIDDSIIIKATPQPDDTEILRSQLMASQLELDRMTKQSDIMAKSHYHEVKSIYRKIVNYGNKGMGFILVVTGIFQLVDFSLFDPFAFLMAGYTLLFGFITVASDFEWKKILQWTAFIECYLGRGLFNVYVGSSLIMMSPHQNFILSTVLNIVGTIFMVVGAFYIYQGYKLRNDPAEMYLIDNFQEILQQERTIIKQYIKTNIKKLNPKK